MLGYGVIAPHYDVELPTILAKAGYRTVCIGKSHFGWNETSDAGIAHGFESTTLYDGLGRWQPSAPNSWNGEWDDYDRWFAQQMPGKDPQATLDGLDGDGWNSWRGRPYIYNEALHPTAWVGRQAVRFLEAYPNDTHGVQPFMLKVSFHRPHSPYDPPQRLLDAVKEEDLRPIKVCSGASPGAHSPDGHGGEWCLRFRGAPGDPQGCDSGADAWCGEMPEAEATMSRRAYAASVNFVDEWIGRIYDTLVERNLLERTWILWTSDHGDGQGDMYHWRKGYPYEFSSHVPMLLRWPATWSSEQRSVVPRGTVIRPPIVTELRDVLHTLVDAAGIANDSSLIAPQSMHNSSLFAAEDGKSMLCLLRDPTGMSSCDYPPNPGPWRGWIDMEHSKCYNMTSHWSALTDGKIKFIYRAWAGDYQLFNLTADPGELTEVSRLPQYAAEVEKWRLRMVKQFEKEGRGSEWVQDGQLVKRTTPTAYSPFYPHQAESVYV